MGTTQKQGLILSLAFVTLYLNVAARFFIPAVIPLLILSLHVSVGYAALLVTSYWIGYTLMQIPAGIIADRFTLSKVNIPAFFGVAAVFSLFYFFMSSFTALLVIQFSLGLVSALVFITDVSLSQTWFSKKQRAMSVGVFQTAFFLGASLGEFSIISMASVNIHLPILVMTVMMFVLATINLFIIRDPEHVSTQRRKTRLRISSGIAYVSLIRFSASFVYLGFLSLFTTYLVTSGDISYSATAKYAWLVAIAGLVGSPLGGILTVRLARTKLYPALFSNLTISLLVITVAFITNVIIIIPIALAMGFAYGFYASPSMSVATELSRSDEEIASASAFLNFFAQLGGSISPVIIGFLADYTGSYSISFVVIGIISLICLVPVAFLIMGRKQDTIYLRAAED